MKPKPIKGFFLVKTITRTQTGKATVEWSQIPKIIVKNK